MSVALVTGASGFVGRQLVNELLQRGRPVRAVVRSAEAAGRFDPRVDVRATGDLAQLENFADLLRDVTTVFHLAARAHVTSDKAGDNVDLYRVSNEVVTGRLAAASVEQAVKRFVFVSSIKVFGELDRGRAFLPGDAPAPADAYGRSKMNAESALWRACDRTGTAAVVVRPPLVYGPGVRANFLRMMQLVRRAIPLPLAAVDNRRSLVSSYNLVDLLCASETHPAAAGRTLLVSDGIDLSTPELFGKVAEAMGRKSRLFRAPVSLLRAAGSMVGYRAEISRLTDSLTLDISETRAVLGWRPPLTVEAGLEQTVRSFLAAQ